MIKIGGILVLHFFQVKNPVYFFIKRYNSSSKQTSHKMPELKAGDVVLEVNRVVVSPNNIDRVSEATYNNFYGKNLTRPLIKGTEVW